MVLLDGPDESTEHEAEVLSPENHHVEPPLVSHHSQLLTTQLEGTCVKQSTEPIPEQDAQPASEPVQGLPAASDPVPAAASEPVPAAASEPGSCWICLDDATSGMLENMCECRGTQRFVHSSCLSQSLQTDNSSTQMYCNFPIHATVEGQAVALDK